MALGHDTLVGHDRPESGWRVGSAAGGVGWKRSWFGSRVCAIVRVRTFRTYVRACMRYERYDEWGIHVARACLYDACNARERGTDGYSATRTERNGTRAG